jgi:WD40 repeat protein
MCASKVMDVAALGRGLLGSGHYDKTVRTYDMRTGALVESAQPHEASLTSVTLSPGSPPCYARHLSRPFNANQSHTPHQMEARFCPTRETAVSRCLTFGPTSNSSNPTRT